ncbi:MAG: TetR/AcrR family transcriptional regulator [Actinobacteria bacterium]|nr:TetR/AcrR family transcriptional regulator [Actinomycetota bacterium]
MATLTRASVVAEARAAIERDGVEKLSLRGVARSLGVTAPALYAYVTDKDDLIAAVATGYFDELATRFDATEATDPLEEIRALSRAYVDHALASPRLFRLLFRYPPGTGAMNVEGVATFAPATRTVEVATQATARAIEAGLLAPCEPVDAAMTMWAAVHGVAEVLLMGFAFDEADRDRFVESVISTVLAGQAAAASDRNAQ